MVDLSRVSRSRRRYPVAGVDPLRRDLPVLAPHLHLGVHHPLGEPPEHLPQQARARRCQGLLELRAGKPAQCSPAATSLSFVSDYASRRIARWPPPLRQHAVLRQTSHIRDRLPMHHVRGREPRRPCGSVARRRSAARPARKSVIAQYPRDLPGAAGGPGYGFGLIEENRLIRNAEPGAFGPQNCRRPPLFPAGGTADRQSMAGPLPDGDVLHARRAEDDRRGTESPNGHIPRPLSRARQSPGGGTAERSGGLGP